MKDYLNLTTCMACEGSYPFAKKNADTGEYVARYPYAGMNEQQKATYDSIKSSASQADMKKTVLAYPDGYFDIDTTGYSDEQKKILDNYTSVAKLSDPRYLNSLTPEELTATVQAGVDAKAALRETFLQGYVDNKGMTDYADVWNKLHDKTVSENPEFRETALLSKATREDLALEQDPDGIFDQYSESITAEQKKESAAYAIQNGFSTFKDKAVNLFNRAKETIKSTTIGAKAIELGEKAVDKVKTVFNKIKNRGEDEFSFTNNDASPSTDLEM